MNFLSRIPTWIILHRGTSAMIVCGFGVAVVACTRCLETDNARTERARRKKEKELRAVADKISLYGRKVHHRFPTGDVVVCERDLAEELRKHPDLVATALNVPLRGAKGSAGSAERVLEAERLNGLVPTSRSVLNLLLSFAKLLLPRQGLLHSRSPRIPR